MSGTRIAVTFLIGLMLWGRCLSGQASELAAQQSSRDKELLSVLEEGKRDTQEERRILADAIREIGERKITQAVPSLIQHIDVLRPAENEAVDVPYSTVNRRAAVKALIAIGEPAVQPVLDAAKAEDSRLRMILMAAVVRGIEGRRGGVRRVEEEMQKAGADAGKKRLATLKDCVKTPPLM